MKSDKSETLTQYANRVNKKLDEYSPQIFVGDSNDWYD